MPGNKTYFLTDAHLGAGADTLQREKELCQLLNRMAHDAARIFFLGDMFDFWFTYRHVVPKGYTRLLGCLAQLADSGIELHYFVGNHDMWMFDYLKDEMHITMHNDPEEILIDGKHFLIGHGDGLGHLDKTYDCLRSLFRNRFNQRLFALLPQWMTFGIASGWSQKKRATRLQRKPEILEYQGDDNEGIVLYCKQQLLLQPLDFCVFGHRHTPFVKQITAANNRTTTYINVGDWLLHRNYAVFTDGQITLHDLAASSRSPILGATQ